MQRRLAYNFTVSRTFIMMVAFRLKTTSVSVAKHNKSARQSTYAVHCTRVIDEHSRTTVVFNTQQKMLRSLLDDDSAR